MIELLQKYHKNPPRYASYPTVRSWDALFKTEDWISALEKNIGEEESLGVYIHIPFCESLCDFCGCNTSITSNHEVEEEYLGLLDREWTLYKEKIVGLKQKEIQFLYLGGGSPNFLSPENLEAMLSRILGDSANIVDAHMEADPVRLKREHVAVLQDKGFTSLSFGVQDLSEEIGRKLKPQQSLELLQEKLGWVREAQMKVLFEFLYGIPGQTQSSILENIEKIKLLQPDRLALYRWVSGEGIKLSHEEPVEEKEKWELYLYFRKSLFDLGYREIGKGYFSKESDSWYQHQLEGHLQKSFSGYHTAPVETVIGLGVSAISETRGAYHQSQKALPVYKREVLRSDLPTQRGWALSEKELLFQKVLQQAFCVGEIEVSKDNKEILKKEFSELFDREFLIEKNSEKEQDLIQVTEQGKVFLRPVLQKIEENLL